VSEGTNDGDHAAAERDHLVIDLNPFAHFEHWAGLGLRIKYTTIETRSGTGSKMAFACACSKPGTAFRYDSITFLAVCSDVQADSIVFTLRRRWPELAQKDPEVYHQRSAVLGITLNHLLNEETFFTFAGPHAIDREPARDTVP
jgi:hypothetical protein